jgi:hypothetical protein
MVIVGAIVSGVVGLGFGMVGNLVKREMKRIDDAIEKLERSTEKISRELADYRLESARNYATQEHLAKVERENSASHGNIHGRIDSISEKVIRIQTVQENCRSCRGDA